MLMLQFAASVAVSVSTARQACSVCDCACNGNTAQGLSNEERVNHQRKGNVNDGLGNDEAPRCQFLLLSSRVTSKHSNLKQCKKPAQWVRTWQGRERFYCVEHKQFLDATRPVEDVCWVEVITKEAAG
jgi:hypothetical protein